MASALTNRAGWWRIVALLLACGVLGEAQRYSFKHYWQDSGLTNLSVNTINQDKDGFLWVATDNGLFRYNGSRFERFGREEGLPQDDVTALAESPGGALWAGTPVGSYLSGGRFHQVPLGARQGEWSIENLVGAENNTAYASTSYGLIKLVLEKGVASVQTIYAGETSALAVESAGTVWFGCGHDLCRVKDGELLKLGARTGLPPDRWANAVIDAQGTLWLCSDTHLYKLLADAVTFVECGKALSLTRGSVSEMRADPIYGVMLPTNNGLALRRGEEWRMIGERQGLSSDGVATAFRDREGSLWIGFRGSGLDRWIGEGQWENWTRAEGLLADTLWGLTKDPEGRIWAGTNRGISMVDPATGKTKTWEATHEMKGNQALTVKADPLGRVWFGGGARRAEPVRSEDVAAAKVCGSRWHPNRKSAADPAGCAEYALGVRRARCLPEQQFAA